MASFKLNRFCSQPEILRGIDPENLVSLLADHADALSVLGFELPDIEKAGVEFDYDAMIKLLMEPAVLPEEVCEALFFIHEMATDEGMECLLDAATEAGIEIVGTPAPTPGDTAIQVWLKDRDLLERKHAEQFLQNARSFQSFGTEVSPVPVQLDATAQLTSMKQRLDDFFEKRKRGRNTKIFQYIREGSVWFLVRHGDPFKREGAIDDKGESYGAYYWPEKFDVLALDPKYGELRINARNKGEKNEYRRVFGNYLYGSETFFSVENKYTLEPLREKGEDAIVPVDGMDDVVLTEVDFYWGGSFKEKEIRKADDVFGAYKSRNRTFPTKAAIIKACFRITFSDSDRPRMVTIKPPNEAQYTRDADSLIVERWLMARGFILKKVGYKHEPTNQEVLVST